MNVQELVINLKVISSLGVNQKLITKEVILNIERLGNFKNSKPHSVVHHN